jgi:hypothetical protein
MASPGNHVFKVSKRNWPGRSKQEETMTLEGRKQAGVVPFHVGDLHVGKTTGTTEEHDTYGHRSQILAV